ncbi:hypothetical protein A8C35_10165 [Ligilactobacillus salivarius]|nr:hypothetical protein A8C35_10165 [Ligilactobacillus salivarius]
MVIGFIVISRLNVNLTGNSKYADFLLLMLINLGGLMRVSILTMRCMILLGALVVFVIMLVKEIMQNRKYN